MRYTKIRQSTTQLRSVSLLLAAFLGAEATAAPVDGALSVVAVAEVTSGSLERSVRQAANLAAYEDVLVYARATGYASKVHVDVGQRVAAGEVLATIDVPEQEAALHAAEADLESAAAMIERATAQERIKKALYELTTDLFEKGARHKLDVEKARADSLLARAELSVAQARKKELAAKLRQAQAFSEYGRAKAPFAGIVTERRVDHGALVREGTSSNAMPLFRVQRVDKLRLRIEIPERQAILVMKSFAKGILHATSDLSGLHLELTPEQLASTGVRFAGAIHPKSKHMMAEIDLDNAEGKLLPGFFGQVTLSARGSTTQDAKLIPNTAIQAPRKAKPFVFLLRPTKSSGSAASGRGRVEKREVRLGLTDGRRTEILDGQLAAGDQVVVRGADVLLDGQEVLVGVGK